MIMWRQTVLTLFESIHVSHQTLLNITLRLADTLRCCGTKSNSPSLSIRHTLRWRWKQPPFLSLCSLSCPLLWGSGLIVIVGGWVPVQNGHVALCIVWCFAMSQYSLKEYTSNNFSKCHPLTCTHCENCSHHLLQSQSQPECAHYESHRAQLRNRDLIFT